MILLKIICWVTWFLSCYECTGNYKFQQSVAGQMALLRCGETTGKEVKWFRNDEDVHIGDNAISKYGDHGKDLLIARTTLDDEGYYKCVEYLQNSVKKIRGMFHLDIVPNFIHSASPGSTVTLTCLSATLGLIYNNENFTWFKDKRPVYYTKRIKIIQNKLSIKQVSTSDEGKFECVERRKGEKIIRTVYKLKVVYTYDTKRFQEEEKKRALLHKAIKKQKEEILLLKEKQRQEFHFSASEKHTEEWYEDRDFHVFFGVLGGVLLTLCIIWVVYKKKKKGSTGNYAEPQVFFERRSRQRSNLYVDVPAAKSRTNSRRNFSESEESEDFVFWSSSRLRQQSRPILPSNSSPHLSIVPEEYVTLANPKES